MLKAPYVVTGASKGLGRAIARNLAEWGIQLLQYQAMRFHLELQVLSLLDIQPDSITITCDLADRADIATAAEQIKAKTTWIAGIVHNAGIISPIKSNG